MKFCPACVMVRIEAVDSRLPRGERQPADAAIERGKRFSSTSLVGFISPSRCANSRSPKRLRPFRRSLKT